MTKMMNKKTLSDLEAGIYAPLAAGSYGTTNVNERGLVDDRGRVREHMITVETARDINILFQRLCPDARMMQAYVEERYIQFLSQIGQLLELMRC